MQLIVKRNGQSRHGIRAHMVSWCFCTIPLASTVNQFQWAGVSAKLQDFWAVPKGGGKLVLAEPEDPEQDIGRAVQ